jgi:hypothetical protein
MNSPTSKKTRRHVRRVHRRRVHPVLDTWQLYSFLDSLGRCKSEDIVKIRHLLRAIAEDNQLWNTLEVAREHEAKRAETIARVQTAYRKLESKVK